MQSYNGVLSPFVKEFGFSNGNGRREDGLPKEPPAAVRHSCRAWLCEAAVPPGDKNNSSNHCGISSRISIFASRTASPPLSMT